ncbi:hypothetical protein [Streptomyces noursei]
MLAPSIDGFALCAFLLSSECDRTAAAHLHTNSKIVYGASLR